MAEKRSMNDRCLRKLIEERDTIQMMVESFTHSVTEGNDLYKIPTQSFVDHHNEIIRRYVSGEPFISSYFCCAPEIYTAMDLPWTTFLTPAFTGMLNPNYQAEVDASGRAFATDLCTIIRQAAYYVVEDLVPPPTAVIAMMHPCDGINVVHQVMANDKKWKEVPVFGADPPYWQDERSLEYYTDQLFEMAAFLEKHTGLKLTEKKLRQACEESNKAYAIWDEYMQTRRAVPCPHGGGMGLQVFGTITTNLCGNPKGTAWAKAVLEDAESLIRQGRGAVPEEKVRLLWFDVLSLGITMNLFPWLEQEWGAVIVMDMFGYYPYSLIDTTNMDTMMRDLAARALNDVPMIRQARGLADLFLIDIANIVKDYKVDAVIYPGYMGHKDGTANIGMMREKCRELGVPFLTIGMDFYDDRYTSPEEVKDKISKWLMSMGHTPKSG